MIDDIDERLNSRLGRIHARQRLGIEDGSLPRIFGKGINFFHPENWYSGHAVIRYLLKFSGFYWRGRRNALDIQIRYNDIHLPHLPSSFKGFKILHLSDLHVDMYPAATEALMKTIQQLEYDLCVITGDYRAWTFGPIDEAMAGMRSLCTVLKNPVYAVLGNHDSIRMVPVLEDMGIKMLLNESIEISLNNDSIYIAGIDDAHYFRVDNIEKSAQGIVPESVSILLSHTPEIYRQAAYAGFDIFLCGHTHGGQICLPGGIPITLDARCPRYMGAGAWRYNSMNGYTSVGAGTSIVNVRLNCKPEVTLHQLHREE